VGEADAQPPGRGTPVSCAWCGAAVAEPPVTWTMQTGDRGVEWMCQDCTRANLRALEGRLPAEW